MQGANLESRSRVAFGAVLLLVSLGAHASSASPSPSPSAAPENFIQRVRCEGMPQKTKDDLWNVSECFFKLGDTLKAAEILRELTRKYPQELKAYFASSWLLWQAGRTLSRTEERARTLEALAELERARVANPTHWEVDVEIGDFYSLRLQNNEKAYAEYLRARRHYEGDYARSVPKAELGMRAAIEDRIARVAEHLDRKGEAVEASCRALFFDPDNKTAKARIDRLVGSCVRKQVKDPREEKGPPSDALKK